MTYQNIINCGVEFLYSTRIEFGEVWRTEVTLREQNVLTLCSQVPSAYPAMCSIGPKK